MPACSVQVMVSVYVDEHDAANKVGPDENSLSVLLRTMVDSSQDHKYVHEQVLSTLSL
jgi:hypothetical protein